MRVAVFTTVGWVAVALGTVFGWAMECRAQGTAVKSNKPPAGAAVKKAADSKRPEEKPKGKWADPEKVRTTMDPQNVDSMFPNDAYVIFQDAKVTGGKRWAAATCCEVVDVKPLKVEGLPPGSVQVTMRPVSRDQFEYEGTYYTGDVKFSAVEAKAREVFVGDEVWKGKEAVSVSTEIKPSDYAVGKRFYAQLVHVAKVYDRVRGGSKEKIVSANFVMPASVVRPHDVFKEKFEELKRKDAERAAQAPAASGELELSKSAGEESGEKADKPSAGTPAEEPTDSTKSDSKPADKGTAQSRVDSTTEGTEAKSTKEAPAEKANSAAPPTPTASGKPAPSAKNAANSAGKKPAPRGGATASAPPVALTPEQANGPDILGPFPIPPADGNVATKDAAGNYSGISVTHCTVKSVEPAVDPVTKEDKGFIVTLTPTPRPAGGDTREYFMGEVKFLAQKGVVETRKVQVQLPSGYEVKEFETTLRDTDYKPGMPVWAQIMSQPRSSLKVPPTKVVGFIAREEAGSPRAPFKPVLARLQEQRKAEQAAQTESASGELESPKSADQESGAKAVKLSKGTAAEKPAEANQADSKSAGKEKAGAKTASPAQGSETKATKETPAGKQNSTAPQAAPADGKPATVGVGGSIKELPGIPVPSDPNRKPKPYVFPGPRPIDTSSMSPEVAALADGYVVTQMGKYPAARVKVVHVEPLAKVEGNALKLTGSKPGGLRVSVVPYTEKDVDASSANKIVFTIPHRDHFWMAPGKERVKMDTAVIKEDAIISVPMGPENELVPMGDGVVQLKNKGHADLLMFYLVDRWQSGKTDIPVR